jgi:hypothetical protein
MRNETKSKTSLLLLAGSQANSPTLGAPEEDRIKVKADPSSS